MKNYKGRASRIVKRLRERDGRSCRQLSLDAELCEAYVSRIEAGAYEPTLYCMEQILEALGYELCIRKREALEKEKQKHE